MKLTLPKGTEGYLSDVESCDAFTTRRIVQGNIIDDHFKLIALGYGTNSPEATLVRECGHVAIDSNGYLFLFKLEDVKR